MLMDGESLSEVALLRMGESDKISRLYSLVSLKDSLLGPSLFNSAKYKRNRTPLLRLAPISQPAQASSQLRVLVLKHKRLIDF